MNGRPGVFSLVGLCVLAGILVAGTVAPAAIGAGLLSNQVSDSVDTISAQLEAADPPLTTTVTDRDGTPIATLYAQYRLPVTAAGIATTMKAAIIGVEDRRFYSEGGVDLQGTLRAAINDSTGGALQGASTLTQQLVKNYLINVVDRTDPAAQQADREDSLARKLREAKMAVQLNDTMSKDDILADYLNVVEFSGTVYGVGAAAKAYFGTTADKLTVPQAALLAGMVNNPSVYNPYTHPDKALQRRNLVIDDMVTNGSIPASYAATAKAAPLGLLPDGPVTPSGTCLGAAPDAGFFCAYAESYLVHAGFTADRLATGGYTIKTTLDPRVSQVAKDAVDANVPTTQDGVANTFAVVQPGSAGHQVLAMVANRNYGTDPARGETSTDIVADASNEFGAGSSFKIFTSAAALVTGKAGLDTPLPNPDSECFPVPDSRSSCYTVHNDGHYADPISLADGLATSPNVAFVGLESQVGMPAVLDMAYKLGLRNTLATNDAGAAPDPASGNPQYSEPQSKYFRNLLSFTLGNSPVSPLEMANVSATLMSGGVWCPPDPILSVTDRNGNAVPVPRQACEQVIPTGVANTLEAGLSRDTTDGTSAEAAHAAGWTRPDIGKTGTTQQSESVAFVGGVDGYAVSSMVFADGPHPREICPGTPVHLGDCGHGAFGGTVAAPPYFHAMSQLLAGVPDQPIPGPDPAYLQARG
ncbi:transglycosylase domain-containing protein [Amycolatopsis sp. SID8362]|uniref:transglycosylase domain-containing protein n=1 Tax=Amycolatopsis sp. SID8362 TaxID=2690346 RepID=UPI00136B50F0|nr:transglycosylase domain-containing protein [Amycolatopsis sp. SID8362]NBH09306.1 penicillin-binding protein [Amycolatopsis sp. SID8362]